MSAAAAGELGPQGALTAAAGPLNAFKAAGQPASAAPTQQSPQQGRAPFTQQVRQRFGRGARQYEQEARLQQATAWRLARLCADLPLPDGPRADLGAGTGLLSRALQSHHRQLRQRPPLQLDLCPELLARNPLAGLGGPPSGRDGHNDLHSSLLNERRGALSSDLCGELPSDLLSDGADNGAADHRPGGPEGQASCGQAFGSHDPVIGHAEGSHPGDSDAGDSPSSTSLADASQLVRANGLIWDLNDGLPDALSDAALLASSFALQWLEDPAASLAWWCRRLGPGGWLVLAVPTAGSFPQWRHAAARAGVPCTALALPEADALRQAARSSGLRLRHDRRLRFSRPRQGGLPTLRHLQRLGASASPCQALSTGQLRRLLAHWPAASPLTWEVLLLIAQRPE